ncbi:MAG: diacylglycerol kinase family protein [Stappiaceae bacterium]
MTERDQDRLLIIGNPTSGGFNGTLLETIAELLRSAGRSVTLQLTSRAGEIGKTCADPDLEYGTVIVAGGDGSINEALSGLSQSSKQTALAVVPTGTANVLALELGIPHSADALAKIILQGKTTPLHYGLVNDHLFVLMASCGFDAAIVHQTPLALKRWFGKLAYVATTLKLMISYKGQDLLIKTETGAEIHCRIAVISNAGRYGGYTILPNDSVTQAGLTLLTLDADDRLSILRFGINFLLGRLAETSGVKTTAIQQAAISCASKVPVQVDGDPFGFTPVDIQVASGTVPILVP